MSRQACCNACKPPSSTRAARRPPGSNVLLSACAVRHCSECNPVMPSLHPLTSHDVEPPRPLLLGTQERNELPTHRSSLQQCAAFVTCAGLIDVSPYASACPCSTSPRSARFSADSRVIFCSPAQPSRPPTVQGLLVSMDEVTMRSAAGQRVGRGRERMHLSALCAPRPGSGLPISTPVQLPFLRRSLDGHTRIVLALSGVSFLSESKGTPLVRSAGLCFLSPLLARAAVFASATVVASCEFAVGVSFCRGPSVSVVKEDCST